MAKMYFRYGSVSSAKTLNLLAVAHNYRQQGKNVLICKPKFDARFGKTVVKTRAGLSAEADILYDQDTRFRDHDLKDIHCILIDEAQFLHKELVDELHSIATRESIPVICYGLRTDFKTNLFEGAHRLMEVADSIEELKTTCTYCDRKAIFNMKIVDGKPTREGPQIDLGAEEKYLPVCKKCYWDRV